jgi:hypothetical protein
MKPNYQNITKYFKTKIVNPSAMCAKLIELKVPGVKQ